MLFVLVMSVLHVFLLMNECVIVLRCHSIDMNVLHVFLLMNEYVLSIQLSFYVVRARYEPCYMCFFS